MDAEQELEARVMVGLDSGHMRYSDAAMLVFRRLCAGSGRRGLAVGSGDFAVPLLCDLAGQPEIERAFLFGLSRRTADRLAADLEADPEGVGLDLSAQGLGRDGGARVDTVLADAALDCLFMALSVPPGELAPLEGATGRLRSDGPVVLVDLTGRKGGAVGSWPASVRAFFEGQGYRTLGGVGQPGERIGPGDGTGMIWAFPAGREGEAGQLIALALAKALADLNAVARIVV